MEKSDYLHESVSTVKLKAKWIVLQFDDNYSETRHDFLGFLAHHDL